MTKIPQREHPSRLTFAMTVPVQSSVRISITRVARGEGLKEADQRIKGHMKQERFFPFLLLPYEIQQKGRTNHQDTTLNTVSQ